jgi:hypothetical protein
LLFPKTDEECQKNIHNGILAIQYTRWHKNFRTSEYNKKYIEAIRYLIATYGEDNFIQECGRYFDFELRNLDLTNLAEEGPHTDFESPYGQDIMSVLRKVIGNRFPIAQSMKNSGHLVNLRTLFGDKHFWLIIKKGYPRAYQALIESIRSWPKSLESAACYSPKVVFPFEVLEQHFNEAYQIIANDLVK